MDSPAHILMSLRERNSAPDTCQEENEVFWKLCGDRLRNVVEDLMGPLDAVWGYMDCTMDIVALRPDCDCVQCSCVIFVL